MRAATNAAPDWSDAVACDISLVQDGGVENASGLAERAERNPLDAQEFLDSLQLAELLKPADAGDDAVEEVDKQEADILVAEELPVAGAIALGSDVAQTFQEGHEEREILQPLKLILGDGWPRFGRHGGAPGIAGPRTGQVFEPAYGMRKGSRKRKLNYC